MSPSERDQVILSLEPKVVRIAKYFVSRIPSAQRFGLLDEFVQAGWLGAIKAVDRHETSKGELSPYAERRIKGEILDYMRGNDRLSRNHRNDIKGSGLAPITLSLDALGDRAESVEVGIEDRRAIREFRRVEKYLDAHSILRRVKLDPRRARLIARYYWQDAIMAEIAREFDIGPARVSQLHADILQKARLVVTV